MKEEYTRAEPDQEEPEMARAWTDIKNAAATFWLETKFVLEGALESWIVLEDKKPALERTRAEVVEIWRGHRERPRQ